MSLVIVDNFSYQGAKPLDDRVVVENLEALLAIPASTIYNGILVYVKDIRTLYVYDNTIADEEKSEETGYWLPFVGGDSDQTEYVTHEELESHAEMSIHVTQADRNKWDAKAESASVPKNLTDLNNDLITNLETLSKVGVNSENKLTYDGGLVANSGVEISDENGNILENKEDGLYVPETVLQEYAKSNDVVALSETRSYAAIDDAIAKTHEHENKEDVLDKLSIVNDKLAYDGSLVSAGSTVSEAEGNIIIIKPDGLYAEVDHTHENKDTLDKFSENEDGQLQFNNKLLFKEVSISAESNNALEQKTDGLYVKIGDVLISEEADNTIVKKDDGIYSAKIDVTDEVKISEADGNIILKNTDGLYVATVTEVPISEDAGNILEQKTDGIYAKAFTEMSDIQISAEDNNGLSLKDDGLYASIGDVAVSVENGNIIQKKDDGIYVKADEITISANADNIISKESDGLYVPDIKISEADGNAISKKTDGIYAPELRVSEDNGNIIKKQADGLFAAETEMKVSTAEGNAAELREGSIYVPQGAVTISPDTDNIIEQTGNGLKVAKSATSDISAADGNIITKKDDGIFAEHNILQVNDVLPNASKKVVIDLDHIPDGSLRKLPVFEVNNLSAAYTGDEKKVVSSDYLSKQFANKADVLDKLSVNDSRKLVYNGELVAASDVDLSEEADNILVNKEDGLYAPATDLSAYSTSNVIEGTYLKQADANTNYLKKTDADTAYLRKSSASITYIPFTGYTNTQKQILGSKIAKDTLSHLNLIDVGNYTHDELEILIDNHVSNTQIHNTANLNAIVIQEATEWNQGELDGFRIDSDGNLSLTYTTLDDEDSTIIYNTSLATYISKIYDVGNELPFNNINWFGNYNPYSSEIKVYVRWGTTPAYAEDTWTAWKDVTATKSLVEAVTQYIQVKVTALNANRTKNIAFKYIQMFYGESTESEMASARVDKDDVEYVTLRLRLNADQQKHEDDIADLQQQIDDHLVDFADSNQPATDDEIAAAVTAVINEWAAYVATQ